MPLLAQAAQGQARPERPESLFAELGVVPGLRPGAHGGLRPSLLGRQVRRKLDATNTEGKSFPELVYVQAISKCFTPPMQAVRIIWRGRF